MFNFELMLSFYLYFISCFMFSYFYKHLLLTMISLEFMVIFLLYNMFNIMNMYGLNYFLMVFMMTMTVCEGALALSLIVLVVRFYGNDYINSMMVLKW